jgi:hypothetical protein
MLIKDFSAERILIILDYFIVLWEFFFYQDSVLFVIALEKAPICLIG